MCQSVAIGDTESVNVPVRNHVMAPLQHPVQCPAACDQIFPCRSVDDQFHQGIDNRVLQADQIT